MEFRYENILLKRMKEVIRKKNKDDKIIIYVQKCDKYREREWKTRKSKKNT